MMDDNKSVMLFLTVFTDQALEQTGTAGVVGFVVVVVVDVEVFGVLVDVDVEVDVLVVVGVLVLVDVDVEVTVDVEGSAETVKSPGVTP